jgi:hypothetical protein
LAIGLATSFLGMNIIVRTVRPNLEVNRRLR